MLQSMAKYETHRAVVRLSGEVNNDSIFALCDEIDLALDYYKYPAVEIQIDSHGGQVDSLDYYLSRLKAWRAGGLCVSTLAMTQTASAAAVILALGDCGRRRAYPSARLHFHHGRIEARGAMNADELARTRSVLDETDQRIERLLAAQILSRARTIEAGSYPFLPVRGVAEPRACPSGVQQDEVLSVLEILQREEWSLTPQDAVALGLIDVVEA